MFSKNIQFGQNNNNGAGGNRCVNIYKNLVRDIRIHFNKKYVNFQSENNIDGKNILIKSAFYPILIKEFFDINFDKNLINKFVKMKECKIRNYNKLYFVFGSFLNSKLTINSIEQDVHQQKMKIISNILNAHRNLKIIYNIKIKKENMNDCNYQYDIPSVELSN